MMQRLAILSLIALVAASSVSAREIDGTINVSGVVINETGNQALVQERYNLYDNVALGLHLRGSIANQNTFALRLESINLDNRAGSLVYNVPTLLRVTSRYRQHRQLFEHPGAVESLRKSWNTGVRVTPNNWLQLSGNYGLTTRGGSRVGFPLGVNSVLGSEYDYRLHTARFAAQARRGAGGLYLAYDLSAFEDNQLDDAKRGASVISAGAYGPDPFISRLTHAVRGSLGSSDVKNFDSDYMLRTIQYTGTAGPLWRFSTRYRFYASQVEESATDFTTDNYIHDVDLTYAHRFGNVTGGYGYEVLDDDRRLTDYQTFRAGLLLHTPERRVKVRARYANRTNDDIENLTLLQETENENWSTNLDLRVTSDFTLSGSFADRSRKLPDIGVEIDGVRAAGSASYYYEYFGDIGVIGATLAADYTFTDDEYVNRDGRYHIDSHFVGSRLNVQFEDTFSIGAGLSFLDVGQDLDIEKTIFSISTQYNVRDDYHVELKYNVFNFDDFVIAERYYTANVFWITLGYDFSIAEDVEE